MKHFCTCPCCPPGLPRLTPIQCVTKARKADKSPARSGRGSDCGARGRTPAGQPLGQPDEHFTQKRL